jgi:hypothetical protein
VRPRGAVVHVAGDPDDVGLEAIDGARDTASEADVFHVAEVHVADESGFTPAPGGWEIGKLDANTANAGPRGIDDTVEADGGCGSEEDFVEQAAIDVDSCEE